MKIMEALVAKKGLAVGMELFEDGTEMMNNRKIDMPNLPFGTCGGTVMWLDLVKKGKWRLQQNMVTKHCRILDEYDGRVAWGTYEGMKDALNRMVNTEDGIEI